jgi:hypothetical protein
MRPNFNTYEEYQSWQRWQAYKEYTIGFIVLTSLIVFGVVFFGGSKAHAYSDEQIVNAIYIAEGGKNAAYPYGIKSVACQSQESCRKICANTVRHNRQRYSKYEKRRTVSFVVFLGNRYCPITGNHLSASERKLNKNWIRNVLAILRKESKNG